MMPDHLTKLVADLDEKLFLEGDRLKQVQQQAFEAYRKLDVRPMAFAGKQYEADPVKLGEQIKSFL